MSVKLDGVKETTRALRKIDPELLKEMNKEIKGIMIPIRDKARGYAPTAAPGGLYNWDDGAKDNKITQRTSAFRGDFGCRNPRDDRGLPDTDCGDGLGLSPRAFNRSAHLDRCRWRGQRGVAGCAVGWVDSGRGPVGNRGGWLCNRSICPSQCAIEISGRAVNPSLFTRSGGMG